jgi:hypothetical protein
MAYIFKQAYEQIFHLPVLKYSQILSEQSRKHMLLSPTIENECISSIERLIINYQCNIDELLDLPSYASRLCSLTGKFLAAPSRHIK